MNKQKPINLTLNFLNEMGVAANNDYAFINREMGIVNSMYEMNNRFYNPQNEAFRLFRTNRIIS